MGDKGNIYKQQFHASKNNSFVEIMEMGVPKSIILLLIFFRTVISVLVQSDLRDGIVFQPGPVIPASKGEVWPLPQSVNKTDDGYFSFNPLFFRFNNVGGSCKTLEEAFNRYRNIIVFQNRFIKNIYYDFKTCVDIGSSRYLDTLVTLDVNLNGNCDDSEYPSIDMKEDYELLVTKDIRELSSNSIWGILRGLETFSQLIYLTDDGACHRVDAQIIKDFPRYSHRGLLLDTARHYQTKDNILKLLDAMSYNKMNVFHWHIVDDYSFPYESNKFSALSEKGSFHPKLMTYDQRFIADVIEYARKRGIRVIPEFDTPGHTLSWGLGHPSLLTPCYNISTMKYGPIDPTKNSSYSFVFALYEEIEEVFPDKYVHLGGDEVDFTCWESNPDIQEFIRNHNLGNSRNLQNYYTQKLINFVDTINLRSIVWEEAFTNGVNLPKNTIVSVWIDGTIPKITAEATSKGHQVIIAGYWYLDILKTGGDWLKFFIADPEDFEGTEEQKKLVLGAEANMWGEVVDEMNLEPRMWPRASAAAERFWSARLPDSWRRFLSNISITDGASIELIFPIGARLQEQTCRMNRRGIRAQPPNGPSICF